MYLQRVTLCIDSDMCDLCATLWVPHTVERTARVCLSACLFVELLFI